MIKKILIAVPGEMLTKIDKLKDLEHRTRCELVREALRRYIKDGYKELGLSLTASELAPETISAA